MMDLTETMDLTEGTKLTEGTNLTEGTDLTEETKLTERFLKKNRTQLILHVEGYFFFNSKYDLPEQLLLSQICI